MQLLLLLGVKGKHTHNLSSMRFLVMLTRVSRTKIIRSEKINNNKILKIIINITLKKSQPKNDAIKISILHFYNSGRQTGMITIIMLFP